MRIGTLRPRKKVAAHARTRQERARRGFPGRSAAARGGFRALPARRSARCSLPQDLGLVRIMRKADPIALRVAEVDGPARPMHDLDALRLQMPLPLRSILGRDAQREEMEPAVWIAKGCGEAVDVAGLQGDELLARSDGQPERALPWASVVEGPSADELETEDVDIECLRARQVLDLDREVMMPADSQGLGRPSRSTQGISRQGCLAEGNPLQARFLRTPY